MRAASSSSRVKVERRVESILKRMTLEEKVDYLGGVDGFYVRALSRLGLPALRMADGPLGVRNEGPSTAYAAGIALAASFDVDLARRVGEMIGRDARARGVHVLLGPGVNIYRSPVCGRNFEYFGEDPFLASRMAVAYIQGVQSQGVSATVKHFVGNESEHDRHHASSEIDERALREIYLPAFEAAVREADVGAVMDAYNLVSGVHMTEHDRLNNGVTKSEWGFRGVIMSDWDATYDGVAAANAGLDLEMPSGKEMNRATLLPALREGRVDEATIDDKVRRILRLAFRFGWLDRAQTDSTIPRYSVEGRALALETARGSMVLLRNQRGFLPLARAKLRSVAVIGPDAHPAVPTGGGSAAVQPFSAVSLLQGLGEALAGRATVTWCRGLPSLPEICETTAFLTMAEGGERGLLGEYFDNPSFDGAPVLTRVDATVAFSPDRPGAWPFPGGRPASARWSGCFVPAISGDHRLVVMGFGVDDYRLEIDGALVVERAREAQPIASRTLRLTAGRPYRVRLQLSHRDRELRIGLGVRGAADLIDPEARRLAAAADVAVVAVGFDPSNEREGFDRTFTLPDGQDDLIDVVRAANRNTVVAITSGGAVDMTRWLDGVRAVIQTWYPGQEGGRALAEILLGDVNPSGKLPATFERYAEDGAAHASFLARSGNKIAYTEGIFVGYRHFDHVGKEPLFPFGHGLSYTRFAFGGLKISPAAVREGRPITVSFDVANLGDRAGAEIAQVYVAPRRPRVPRPPKELKGFARVFLEPGQTRRLRIKLDERALAFYDVPAGRWTAAPGDFDVLVGSSSRRIALRGKLTLR